MPRTIIHDINYRVFCKGFAKFSLIDFLFFVILHAFCEKLCYHRIYLLQTGLTAMEQHTKKHSTTLFLSFKKCLGQLKIAMRGAFLNIKSMLALQIIYSIFYTLIEYSLFQLLLSIALKIDGYSFLNSANIGRFLITPPAIAMLLILFLTACVLTYLNACILLGGFQASLARQKLRMNGYFSTWLRKRLSKISL